MAENDGLDPYALTALLHKSKSKERAALARTADFNDVPGYVSFSGGKDSLVALHLAKEAGRDVQAVFFQSDLEFPENLDYIPEVCDALEVPLTIIKPRTSILEIIVREAWFDNGRDAQDLGLDVHDEKITRPSRRAHRKFGPLAIWGTRMEESTGRRYLLAPGRGVNEYEDHLTFSPVWNWSSAEVRGYIAKHHLPVNPVYEVYDSLGVPPEQQRVGATFDGNAGLDFGGVRYLKLGWPALYDKLRKQLPRIEEYT